MGAKSPSNIGLSGALLLLVVISVLPAYGTMEKDLNIESVPSGADVYLKQATREILIGKTPFIYRAEFHSEVSILRMTFKKQGYETKTFEVSAKQDKVEVNLVSRPLFADPDTIQDPTLRQLQKRLAAEFNFKLQEFLSSKGPFEFDLAAPAWVTRLDDKIFLILPVELGKSKERMNPLAQSQNEVFLRIVWEQFGQGMVIPLVKEVHNEPLLNGILLDIGYSRVRYGFDVSSHMESRIEMECVPGMEARQVYNPCLRRKIETYYSMGHIMTRDAGCEGGFQTQMVHNPCVTKVPVTRTEVKIDPKSTTIPAHSRAQYVFSIDLIEVAGEQEKVYPQLGILLTNEKGEIVIKRGFIPSSLPRIPKDR